MVGHECRESCRYCVAFFYHGYDEDFLPAICHHLYHGAAHWFRKAAEQREAAAQLQLGKMYTMGKGVAQNDDEALYWYQKAAEQGLNEAKQMIKEIDNGVLLK